jgi:signal transduction histidine kinase
MVVEDDGVGFDPSSIPSGHMGLAGIRARAAQAGGHALVTSAPGHGARIEVRLPRASTA